MDASFRIIINSFRTQKLPMHIFLPLSFSLYITHSHTHTHISNTHRKAQNKNIHGLCSICRRPILVISIFSLCLPSVSVSVSFFACYGSFLISSLKICARKELMWRSSPQQQLQKALNAPREKRVPNHSSLFLLSFRLSLSFSSLFFYFCLWYLTFGPCS